MNSIRRKSFLLGCLVCLHSVAAAAPQGPDHALARALLQELIDINTAPSGGPGQTRIAAERMAAHLIDAGFPAADIQVLGPDPADAALVARYRSSAPSRGAILMMAHLDVVEALPADWSLDPFTFTERDGYYYGRGTVDNKAGAAMMVANFIRLREEGFEPDRDLVIVLSADEETTGDSIQWLLKEHRDLLQADFALNTDGGSVLLERGDPRAFMMQTSEKIYTTFRLRATNAGGHSSLPRPDNAIYSLIAALQRIADYRFPISLNDTTRAFFERWQVLAEDKSRPLIRALLRGKLNRNEEQQLAASFYYNALARTTCVATELSGGHAENALPQSATASVNCRVLPHSSAAEVQGILERLIDGTGVSIEPIYDAKPSPPSPLTPELMDAFQIVASEIWPGLPAIPEMSTGATDGLFVRNAGIPVYGVSAIAENSDEDRAHGRDERIRVDSYRKATDYWYRLTRRLAQPGSATL